MDNQLEPQTDREIMLHLDRKIDLFADRLERLTSVLEKLETIKFEGHEERLAAIEKEINQWKGITKVGMVVIVVIQILIQVLSHFGK
jgi:hypothetical protein